jgi:signal peptidase II
MVGAPSSEPGEPTVRRPPARHRVLFLVVAGGWILVDQLSKSWAVARLPDGDIDVVGSLRLNLAYNSGASFSMGDGYGRWIALVAVVIVGLLVWQGLQATSRLTAVSLGMIVGGALGNVVDRAVREGRGGFLGGSVVDFIDLQWWPVFNVADVGVVVGAILLVVSSLLPVPDEPDQPDAAEQPDRLDRPDDARPGA